MRICDLAYNQLVLRYRIKNVLRTIGPDPSAGKQGLSYRRPERETLTLKLSVRDHALAVIFLAAGAVFFSACGLSRGSISSVPE